DPRRVRRGDSCSRLERAPIAIEELGLRVAVEECVVLMLAVDAHEPLAKLAQLARRGGAAVYLGRARFFRSSTELALQLYRVEDRLNERALRSVPHLVDAAPRAKGEAEGVDDQRFAAARLAGEQVETRPETNRRFRDQGEVADSQLSQQRSSPSALAGGPSRAW